MKRLILMPIAALAAAVVIAGCGSGGGGSATAASSPKTATASVITTKKGPLGTYLVDGSGRTLYLFEADSRNMSNCNGACLSLWPAFTGGGKAPVAKGGVMAGKLGVTAPGSGQQIVTYNGHPLYYYAADQKPGDTTGQGLNQFGANWEVVDPSGSGIDG